MSDSNPPAPWSAADAWQSSPKCPVCDTHDFVDRTRLGVPENAKQVWFCSAPFCGTVFDLAQRHATDSQRAIHRAYFEILERYLAEHPERRMSFTDEIRARRPEAAMV